MWCRACQQDVPGIAAGGGQCRCARCGASIEWNASSDFANSADLPPKTDSPANASAPSRSGASSFAEKGRRPLGDWQLDEDLQLAEQFLESSRRTQRWHEPHDPSTLSLQGTDAARRPIAKAPRNNDAPASRGGMFVAALLLFGAMTLACGGVLLGWSYAEGRAALWDLGVPITLVGQAALVVGLIFQVDRMISRGRRDSERMAEVDEQIDELHHATSMLENAGSGPSTAFYSHWADGASPRILLSDLKGQIDLLHARLARRERR